MKDRMRKRAFRDRIIAFKPAGDWPRSEWRWLKISDEDGRPAISWSIPNGSPDNTVPMNKLRQLHKALGDLIAHEEAKRTR